MNLSMQTVTFSDTREPGCWASVNRGAPCNRPAATDLGLCDRHLAEYRNPETLHDGHDGEETA